MLDLQFAVDSAVQCKFLLCLPFSSFFRLSESESVTISPLSQHPNMNVLWRLRFDLPYIHGPNKRAQLS